MLLRWSPVSEMTLLAGSDRGRVATYNFPRNRNIIIASQIRRRGKCWTCLPGKLQNTKHSLRTPRIAGKKFAMAYRSLKMHQDIDFFFFLTVAL